METQHANIMERHKTPFLSRRAAELRNQSSATEQRLWSKLRNRQLRGYRFRRRPIVLGKIPDFGCPEAQLVIQIDGFPDSAKAERNSARDQFLVQHGIRTLHVSSEMIWHDLDTVTRDIAAYLPSAQSTTGRRRCR